MRNPPRINADDADPFDERRDAESAKVEGRGQRPEVRDHG
jgi:hypothetical protein